MSKRPVRTRTTSWLTLPVEKDRNLLAEYGRAFAWINAVEGLLEVVIYDRGKLHMIDPKLAEKLTGGKMLGQKIKLADGLLKPSLLSDLKLLNEKRGVLAHSGIIEERDPTDGNRKTGRYAMIRSKGSNVPLNIVFTDGVVALSQKIAAGLHREMAKGVIRYPLKK